LIATLFGELKHVLSGSVIVEVAGVGFEVVVSQTTREAMPAPGSIVFLHTYLHLREEDLRLFGFAGAEEKQLFLLLIDLPKVGVKTALDIVSTFTVNEFRRIVLKEDLARLTQVPGVGRKTAERLLFELKERLERLPEQAEAHRPAEVEEDLFEQAVQGLMYLGCKYPVAVDAVRRAAEVLGSDAPLEELIREGLKHRTGT